MRGTFSTAIAFSKLFRVRLLPPASPLAHDSGLRWRRQLIVPQVVSHALDLNVGVERIPVHLLDQLLLLLLLEPIELYRLVRSADLVRSSYDAKAIPRGRHFNLVRLEGIRRSHRVELVLELRHLLFWVRVALTSCYFALFSTMIRFLF